MTADYYGLLDVRSTATREEIRAAFLAKIKKVHPDVAGSNEKNTRLSQALNEAYACLCDPIRRLAYDESRRKEKKASASSHRGATTARWTPRGANAGINVVFSAILAVLVILVAILGIVWVARKLFGDDDGTKGDPVPEAA